MSSNATAICAPGRSSACAEAIEEQHAVGQIGQRIVQRLVADVVFGPALLDRVGEDVRHRLDEVGVGGRPAPLGGSCQPQHPPAALTALDLTRDPAGELLEPERRVLGRRRQTEPGAQGERRPVGRALEHGALLDTEDARSLAERMVHQLSHLGALERALSQPRHGGLLGRAALELALGELAVGYVQHHAVPARAALLVGEQHGFVAYPHDPPVAVEHPVFVGGARLLQRLLAREHELAILGVHLARPQAAVAQPLLGREAEDRLGAPADVVPAAVDARVGDVHDRGQQLDERTRSWLGRKLASEIVRPAIAGRSVWGMRCHVCVRIGRSGCSCEFLGSRIVAPASRRTALDKWEALEGAGILRMQGEADSMRAHRARRLSHASVT